MSRRQRCMIITARRKHGRIRPCAGHDSLASCFTTYDGSVIFWYNTVDGSTHADVDEERHDPD